MGEKAYRNEHVGGLLRNFLRGFAARAQSRPSQYAAGGSVRDDAVELKKHDKKSKSKVIISTYLRFQIYTRNSQTKRARRG